MIRRLTTSKGENFETTLTDQDAFAVLRRAVEADNASSFARSLVLQATIRGLSEKQWVWVHKLAMERSTPVAPVASATTSAAGGFVAVVAMLTKAGATLKWPRVSYRGLRLTLAGARSRQPGTVNVAEDAGSFESRDFYGRISLAGRFEPARSCPSEVVEILNDLAEDPAAKVAAEGKRVGHCCFCSRELSTTESLAAGYGPVCAEKYGLPWGGSPDATEAPVDEAPVLALAEVA